MADNQIEVLRKALLKVVETLQIGPPGTLPGTMSEVEGALKMCDVVRAALSETGQAVALTEAE